MHNIKKILFCTDFSDNADLAFEYTLDMCSLYNAELTILHVTHSYKFSPVCDFFISMEVGQVILDENQKAAMEEVNKRYKDQLGEIKYTSIIRNGYPATEIIDFIGENDFDLIILGAHGSTGLPSIFFGSTAERVVRNAPCPVLTIRSKT